MNDQPDTTVKGMARGDSRKSPRRAIDVSQMGAPAIAKSECVCTMVNTHTVLSGMIDAIPYTSLNPEDIHDPDVLLWLTGERKRLSNIINEFEDHILSAIPRDDFDLAVWFQFAVARCDYDKQPALAAEYVAQHTRIQQSETGVNG